ncbi:UNVERIFIED_CONTAM: LOB domain-containing protein 38 [Sesamum calycinum]|uniref:LOB domain-containing protein 38 n=1 Tax=Sesamum calycinum TaxID=2727403 RepID=A0AAW2MMP7_9LAMI
MSFISAVPENQRPALFQSLLFEAARRTVNPVNGAVGLLWTGNWHVCQAAVETVLRGGALKPIPEFMGGASEPMTPRTCSNSNPSLSPRPRCRNARSGMSQQR